MTIDIAALIITFRRDDALRKTLRSLHTQTMLPTRVTVWDNANSAATAEIVAEEAKHFPEELIRYVGSKENIGPAGALSMHMKDSAERSADSWVIRIDDDADLQDPHELRHLVRLATRAVEVDPLTAAVGLRGATFDSRRGILRAATLVESNGLIKVDTLHGGYLPMFKAGPASEVGGFNADFFFGFEELEFGLRLAGAGFAQYAAPNYIERNPASFAVTGSRLVADNPGWRHYYSVRNLICIVREFGSARALVEIVGIRSFAKPLANLIFRPRVAVKLLRLNSMAVRDAFRGRLGRRVEPNQVHAETVFASVGLEDL